MSDRIDSLQCIRGLAAFGVFLSHISQVEKLHFATSLPPGMGVGAFGVDLFFVLSGFVIIHSLTRRPSGWRETVGFLAARWGRILPAYWAVLIPCVLVATLVAPSWISDAPIAPLLQSALLLPASAPPVVHPAWSLVHELYFYEVLAVFVLLPRRWLVPGLALWGLAMAATLLIVGEHAGPVIHLAANPLNFDFLLGVAVRLVLPYLRPAWPRLQTAVCAAAFLAGAAVLTAKMQAEHWGELHRVFLVGIPAAGIVWSAAGWQPGTWPRIWAALKGLGDRSYAFYLVHFPICMVIGSWMSTTGRQSWGDIALYVVLAIVCTALTTEALHRIVERPSLKMAHALARRITSRKAAARPSSPTVVATQA